MSPWLIVIAGVAIAGAYVGGRVDGAKIAAAADLKTDRAAAAQRKLDQDAADTRERDVAAPREQQRQQDVRETYRELRTVVEKPIYRNVCVDDAGVRLLDRAAAIANGSAVQPTPADPPAPASPSGAVDR